MGLDQVITIGREAILTIISVAAPCLVISITTGFLVSIFQATTQIHDQTLSFVPKIVAVMLSLMLFGNWMLRTLVEFAVRIMDRLAQVI